MIFKNIFKRKKEKNLNRETERSKRLFWDLDRVVLNENIEHQGIGGKIAYIEREVSVDDILNMTLFCNVAALNFTKRRPDLFEDFYDLFIPDDKLVKDKAKTLKFYYVKILQKNNTYLGYFIASDEFNDIIKAKDTKEEPIWI